MPPIARRPTKLIKPKLRETALKQLEAQLGPGEFIIPESLGGTILESTFDHEITEQADELTLLMRVAYTAQKVKSEDANSLVFGALQAQTPPDYELIPEGLSFQRGEVTAVPETEDLYQFPMQGTGYRRRQSGSGQAVNEIAGKSIDEARDLLQEALRLKKTPQITVFPEMVPLAAVVDVPHSDVRGSAGLARGDGGTMAQPGCRRKTGGRGAVR